LTDLFLQILIIFLLIVANGVLAMSEIAVVSARKARLQQQAEQGNARPGCARSCCEPERFLATSRSHYLGRSLGGAFGGATIAEEIANLLREPC